MNEQIKVIDQAALLKTIQSLLKRVEYLETEIHRITGQPVPAP